MLRVFRHYIPMNLVLLVGGEGAIVLGSVYAGFLLPLLGLLPILPTIGSPLPTALLLSVMVFLMCHVAGLYDSLRRYGQRELFLRLGISFFGAYLLIAMVGYLLPSLRLSRQAYSLSFLVSFPGAFALRLAYDRLTVHSRRRRRVLLLGSGPVSRVIAETINSGDPNYELVGCVDGHPDRTGEEINGVRILGAIEDLSWVSKITKPDVIVVAMEERRGKFPLAEIMECKLQGIEVHDYPNFYEMLTGRILIENLRPSWLVFSDGFRKTRTTRILKRVVDVLVSLIGCALSAPLIPVISALIKLGSRGPVFFRQDRVGESGRIFSLIKFRTMREDAERESGPVWATEADPRITRVGRFLRLTRLDEVPQLWNVLRGNMSLIGPRPERPVFVAQLQEQIPFYSHRHVVKPGITGWAQVKYRYGASVEDAREKLQYDLYYVKNLSIFLDLLTLLHTFQVVLFTRGSR